jgi:hypothetical protein
MTLDEKYKNLNKILLSIFGSPILVSTWWSSPLPSLDFQKPQDLWANESDRVINHVISTNAY